MGFSFRSLYADDQVAPPDRISGAIKHKASERPSAPSILRSLDHAGKTQQQSKTGSQSMPSGIPGPLQHAPLAQNSPKTANTLVADRVKTSAPSDDGNIFYSLDSLQAETAVKNTVPGARQEPTPASQQETDALTAPASCPDNSSTSATANHDAQIQLRAIFSTNEAFTLDNIATLAVQLPGVTACLLQNSGRTVLATAELESIKILENHQDFPVPDTFAAQLNQLGQATVDGILLRSTSGSVSCFSNNGFSLMAHHDAENPPVGLWEKLFLITQAGSKLAALI